MTPRRTRRGDDSGAAAVEFALIVIPLMMIVVGIINFGFIFASQINLNSAARDAARAGVVQPLGGTGMACKDIAALARDSSGSVGSPKGGTAVTVSGPGGSCAMAANTTTVTGSPNSTPCTGAGAGAQLEVSLTKGYASIAKLVPPTSLTQRSTGRFQCEYV